MADFSLSTNVNGEIVIINTSGYLNNIGGEKIADACYKEIENGKSLFLLDLEDSKVVNSIGVSILIEIIENLQEVKLAVKEFLRFNKSLVLMQCNTNYTGDKKNIN